VKRLGPLSYYQIGLVHLDHPAHRLLFRRASISDQASAALREGIRTGLLADPLPGEHQLARQFGISRSSIRLALAQLESEGHIVRSNGRRARLNLSGSPAAATAPPVVCMVCPVSRETLSQNQHPIVMEMHANCATKGIGWEEAFDARLDGARPERHLRQLVGERKNVCWILLACTAPIQRWFARAGVPTFVLGSCLPGVELPSIDIDYRAVGWHAAGTILKEGHRHIGLLQPRRPLAGDLAAHEGFIGYVKKSPAQVSVTTVLVDANQDAFRSKLNQLAKSPNRPTALFSIRLAYALSAMFTLLQAGLRLPSDLSLVLGDSHSLIDTALPEITRYRDVNLAHAERAVRIAEALLAGHPVPAKPTFVIPTFIGGGTLGPPPAAVTPR
jgi:DNA-binding LacI/PurR family transcriptional regulator